MIRFTSIIDRRINKKGHPISISDLSTAIEITSATGSPAEEQKILKGIVRFGNIEVKEIMRARVDVVAVDTAIGFEDLKRLILDTGYSRIPAYAGTFDNIRGILYVKDILPHLDEKGDFSWNTLLRDAFFVPENKKINDLLREFQEKKIHLAIVVDEYGGTSGIVTLEDIIEEIVGEISDEYDTESDKAEFTKIGDGTYFFEGKTSLNDFCKILGVDDSLFDVVKGESDTLAGMVLEIKGKIPEPREEITVGNLILRIESVDKRRIKKIRVTVGPGKTGEKE